MEIQVEEFGPNWVKFVGGEDRDDFAGFQRIFPAGNLQISGYPQTFDDHLYGIYFEVPFESGRHYVLSQMFLDDPIMVEEYPDFRNAPDVVGCVAFLNDWSLVWFTLLNANIIDRSRRQDAMIEMIETGVF